MTTESDANTSVAWGDVDGDGDLDLAVGNQGQRNQLYRNDGGTLTPSAVWSSAEWDSTWSVAWGDYDGDGDLDLAVGNHQLYSGQPTRLYRNDGGTLTSGAVWSSSENNYTWSVAWGDYDGDGDLDLAVGNGGPWDSGCGCYISQPNRLYRNDGVIADVPQMTLVWSSVESDNTHSVAWGDYDGDGDLDLAVGNNNYPGQPNRLYRNDGVIADIPQITLVWSSTENDDTESVAWGDVDGDGDLDLAVANGGFPGQPNRLYRNDGVIADVPQMTLVWSSTENDDAHSVAWGDYDGDSDLDLAIGSGAHVARGQPTRLYRNDSGTLTPNAVWSSTESDSTHSVAWGDVDGDGDLDLAVGYRLYRNDGEALIASASAVWSSTESDNTESVAWGDVDGDGDLDLAVGNGSDAAGQPNHLYHNDGGTLTASAVWTSTESDNTRSLAWGDVDGDGDLDLAVGNSGSPNRLYRNDGGVLTPSAVWSSTESDNTESVAWGDYDGDGDLDLVVGNSGQPNRLYRNDGGVLTVNAVWTSTESDNTRSVAWGDVDGDGDLDLAVGNWASSRLYRNDGVIAGVPRMTPLWSTKSDGAYSVAWGDVDGDGDLDLAIGNYLGPTQLYRNDSGALTSGAIWTSMENNTAQSVAWGDYDGDGDLDLAVGNGVGDNRLYRNDGGTLTSSSVWSPIENDYNNGIAWGDYDGDGDLDLVVGNNGSNRLYQNRRDGRALPGSVPTVHLARPFANADFFSSPRFNSGVVPITYTLADPQGDPVKSIRAWYSPDGGGRWLQAAAATSTITANLVTTATYTYRWDIIASGFFGQSDNVIFRIEAVPAITHTPRSIPGPYLYGSYASSTFPFRVRGTQVRVLSGTQPISNALVYRLPITQTVGALPFAALSGEPFHTDGQGYLQGRGQLNIGDRLIALYPITSTDAYTLYFTSAAPTLTGLSWYTVTQGGVQTLTVSPANSLVLFNLDVSLEWDARQDTQFLSQLQHDLQRTSELLYDWTNGQAALGHVNLYFDKEKWNDAHVRIYATNRLRPNASQGGIVSDLVVDPVTVTTVITYTPGQINIGAVWNRYGESNGNLGEDWPRALAHELGHFALFLDDDYLGLDTNGRLIPVDTCTGTAMSDPYREDYSEFHFQDRWTLDCANTLANQETGRWDWATITTFYPWLKGTATNPGPSGLPLQVLNLKWNEPITPSTVLPAPIFNLVQNGARVQPGQNARAFLYQADRAIDLGSPTLDQVNAHGARVGDRLCVYELGAQRLGCETITAGDEELALVSHPDWQPEIQITPVNSRTINLTVNAAGLPPALTLSARLYPIDAAAGASITLMHSAASVYSGTFVLPEPVAQGVVQVWVNEPEPRREAVVDYGLGGGAAYRHGRDAYRHGRDAYRHGRDVPAQSPDGQVVVFADGLIFEAEDFFALQAVNTLLSPPPGHTLVGQAYRLLKSANAPSLVGATISFYYAGRDVPAGEENFLAVHFWDGAAWQKLATTLDTEHNIAVATIPATANGLGLYALLSSIEIPLYGPGWDQFSYPVQATRPITEALLSIDEYYSIVYWYDGSDASDHWKVFARGVPGWVSDLSTLQFAESYWISLTQPITLSLSGSALPNRPVTLQSPPATYYGAVLPGGNFTPAAGQAVTAWINGQTCGQSLTQNIGGQIVYSINVVADGPGGAIGCGDAGRTIIFSVEGQLMLPRVEWDNNRMWEVPLRTAAITDLLAVNSSPTPLGQVTWFTATATGNDLSYIWNFGDGSPVATGANASRTYPAVGIYTALVTATNGVDTASATTQVTITGVLDGVTFSGPLNGRVNTAYAFTATVLPDTATLPLTYFWQATDLPPVTATGGLTHTVIFNWPTAGTKTLTVTVSNAAGTVSNVHTIVITKQEYRVSLPLIRKSPK